MDTPTYHLQTGSGQYSPPLTLETLIGYARSGAIRPDTFVYDGRASTWIPAHQIPELSVVFASSGQASIPTFQSATPAMAVAQPRAPMSTGAKVGIGLGIAMVLLLCGGGIFGMFSLVKKGVEEVNKPQTFVSTSGLVDVTAPGMWSQQSDLHEDAVIQVSDSLENVYLMVLEEPVTDFDGIDLENYSKITREQMLSKLKNAKLGARTEPTVNGGKAIQYEIEGTSDFIRLKYLHAVVGTKTHFYQLVGWGAPSDFDSKRAELEKVMLSFKEKGAAVGTSPN